MLQQGYIQKTGDKTNLWCNRSREKGAKRKECYISLCSQWHDEIWDNILWKKNVIRVLLEAAMLKVSKEAWNAAEGEQRRKGFGGRDRGRHEQASKCQEEMNSWRWNLHWEVCVSCDWACTYLYGAAYLLACLYQTCRRTCINVTCKNKHLPMQLTVST